MIFITFKELVDYYLYVWGSENFCGVSFLLPPLCKVWGRNSAYKVFQQTLYLWRGLTGQTWSDLKESNSHCI